jgi:PAS domain S-box-containing protein
MEFVLKSGPQPSKSRNTTSPAPRPLHAALVGEGKACMDLFETLKKQGVSQEGLKIVAMSPYPPHAPSLESARAANIIAFESVEGLCGFSNLDLIVDLTDSSDVAETVLRLKAPSVSYMNSRTAGFLWNLMVANMERARLEKGQHQFQEKIKQETQVLLDSLPYRLMVINLDKTITTVNRPFLKEFGFTREEVIGKPCNDIGPGIGRPCRDGGVSCWLDYNLDELKQKGTISYIKEYDNENGETLYDVITVGPIYNEVGDIVQIVQASRDVTERIRLEGEVQKASTFFQNVIQSTVDGIVVVDTKGNVLIFNEGMERLTGYSAEEIIETGHLISFYDIDVAKENMRKMRSDRYGPVGKLNPTSMTVTTKTGEEIPVTLSASIITINDQEVGSVGVFTDMREVLQMRKDLEEVHLQLVQSEKIASVGRMAAGVAHEINNPLAGIMMYAELLKEELANNPQYLSDIQVVIDQTIRCKKIVSDLLEFSRQSVGKAVSFSLQKMIEKSLALLIHQALFQNIEVDLDIEEDMPEMIGDLGQLQQVITNLLINAADAMEGKGNIRIDAKFISDANQFEIQLADSGPGIPEADRDKIFDMFFSTKPVGKGTGLGLSISQNIIKLHGGTMAVDCPPKGGTVFKIILPLGFVEQAVEEPIFVGLEEEEGTVP